MDVCSRWCCCPWVAGNRAESQELGNRAAAIHESKEEDKKDNVSQGMRTVVAKESISLVPSAPPAKSWERTLKLQRSVSKDSLSSTESKKIHAKDANDERGAKQLEQEFDQQAKDLLANPLFTAEDMEQGIHNILHGTLSSVYEILRNGSGGIIIAVIGSNNIGMTELMKHYKYLDDGNLTKCLHKFAFNIHHRQGEFIEIVNAFCCHDEGDRWSRSQVMNLKQKLKDTSGRDVENLGMLDDLQGTPKDGAIIMSQFGDVAGGACHLQLSPQEFELWVRKGLDRKPAGTRHSGALGLAEWMSTNNCSGCVFVRSDDGGAHALLPNPDKKNVKAFAFDCLMHLSQESMLAIFGERIKKHGELKQRTEKVLARRPKDGERLLDVIGGQRIKAHVFDGSTWLIKQLTPTQKEYSVPAEKFANAWVLDEPKADLNVASDLPMLPKVRQYLHKEGWKVYRPSAMMCRYLLEITKDMTQESKTGKFIATWGAVLPLVEGEYLCMPKDGSEIYRMLPETAECCYWKRVSEGVDLSQESMLEKFKDRILQEGQLKQRADNVLARLPNAREQMYDTIDGQRKEGRVFDGRTWIVKQLSPSQKDYPLPQDEFHTKWELNAELDISNLPMLPKVRKHLEAEGWKVYRPKEMMRRHLLRITQEIIAQSETGKFITKWGAVVPLVEGDYLCMPENGTQIYKMLAETVECCYTDVPKGETEQ